MNFGDIVGQSAVTENLARQMRSGQIVHAFLFTGEHGSGKRTLARICAQTLLCRGEARPCGECGPCVRFLTNNHPDVLTVEPGLARGVMGEKGSKVPKSIGVDDVRALSEFLSRRPYEGDRNIVIVPQAHLMTPQAQNALLKTLETPPGNSVLFLCTDNLRAMLPTIVSRCRTVNLPPVSADTAYGYLTGHGVEQQRARLLSMISGGSIGRALEMNENADYWNAREATLGAIGALDGISGIADFTYKLKDLRDKSDWVFDTLELYARDMMLCGLADALNADMVQRIEAQSKKMSGRALLEGVINARQRLKSNVGWNQVLDMLCFDALEV